MRDFFFHIIIIILLASKIDIAIAYCLKGIKSPEDLNGTHKLVPTSKGVFLKTKNNIYRLNQDNNEFQPINEQTPLLIRQIHDTEHDVYFVESETKNIFRYRENKAPKQLTVLNDSSEFLKLISADSDKWVYVVGKTIIRKLYNSSSNRVDESITFDKINISDKNFFKRPKKNQNSLLIQKTNGDLYRIGKDNLIRILDKIEKWYSAFSENGIVFIWDDTKIYQLDKENNSKEAIFDKEIGYLIRVYVLINDVFAVTENGLFRQLTEGDFKFIPGTTLIKSIYSFHKLDGETYIIAGNGVFRISPYNDVTKIINSPEETLYEHKKQTKEGVFFVDSNVSPVTFLLTNDGNIHKVNFLNQPKKIYDITDTSKGIFLSALQQNNKGALYRFEKGENQWIKIPSHDAEVYKKVIEGEIQSGDKSSNTVFVNSRNGIFQYVESPLLKADIEFDDKFINNIVLTESLVNVKWKLLNFPCDDVPDSIEQKLVIIHNGKNIKEIKAKRSDDSSKYPWTAVVNRFDIPEDGKYILKVNAKNGKGINKYFNQTHEVEVNTGFIEIGKQIIDSIPKWQRVVFIFLVFTLIVLISVWILLSVFRKSQSWFYFIKGIRKQIFISYRRNDAGGYVVNLFSELGKQFYKGLIFYDKYTLNDGEKFKLAIYDAIEQGSVLLAIIGPDWLNIESAPGKRRLDDPEDYVRQEILLAFKNGNKVIPILVGGATIPEKDELPEPLKPLLDRNVYELKTGKDKKKYQGEVYELAKTLSKYKNIPRAKFPK